MTPVPAVVRDRADSDPARGFAHARDFLLAVRANYRANDRDGVSDYRLRALSYWDASGLAFMLPVAFTPASLRAAAGSDEQSFVGVYGPATAQELTPFALGATEGDPTAGRTLRLPMSTPDLAILARSDKNHSTSISGGLTVVRTGETLPRASSRAAFERIQLHADDLSGFSYVTEELIGDNPMAVVAILEAAYRDEFADRLLKEKIRGLGGDQYIGVLTSDARITVAKETLQAAATINATNVVKMAARCWRVRQAIWLANHDCRPELYKLSVAVGTGGFPVYTPSAIEGSPDMMLGAPVFYSEHCSALGTEGDIILANWSQYVEATYQPLQSDESIHVRFLEVERAFRFSVRNAGCPWWRAPLTPANSTTTLSPIVTLAVRA